VAVEDGEADRVDEHETDTAADGVGVAVEVHDGAGVSDREGDSDFEAVDE
jgi:hypothetical protein